MKQAGTATYAINGLGQRVKKNNGTDVFFAYDEAGHLIGEYDATGAPIEETVWLGDLPVAVVKPNAASFEVFYIWTDNLGTPRLITDTANQSRWEWPNADPFGNNLPDEDPAGLGAFAYNLRFPGQYYDAEKGSSYNYFRDYDPSIGRYIESDPIGLRAGLNTYAYVGARPLQLVDRLGREPGNMYQRGYGLPMPDFGAEPGLVSFPPRYQRRPKCPPSPGVVVAGSMAAGGGAGFLTGGIWGLFAGLAEGSHFGAAAGIIIADATTSGAIAFGVLGAGGGALIGTGIAIYIHLHPEKPQCGCQ
jgi:RHS repeat-associated protein